MSIFNAREREAILSLPRTRNLRKQTDGVRPTARGTVVQPAWPSFHAVFPSRTALTKTSKNPDCLRGALDALLTI
jgi:hypothetical protein